MNLVVSFTYISHYPRKFMQLRVFKTASLLFAIYKTWLLKGKSPNNVI